MIDGGETKIIPAGLVIGSFGAYFWLQSILAVELCFALWRG
jgi:hypothetical protein